MQQRQRAALNTALALALVAITAAVLYLIVRNVQAVALIRENARQSALITALDEAADDLALEVEKWVRTPKPEHSGSVPEVAVRIPPELADTYPLLMEHPHIAERPSVLEAIQQVDKASAALLDRLDPSEHGVANRLAAAHRGYVDSIVGLSDLEAAGRDLSAAFDEQTHQAEGELRGALRRLSDDQNRRIQAAIVETDRVELLLRWWMPALFISAMLAAAYLLWLQAMQRREQIERMEQVSLAKDRFIASVSHELRTPLTVVIGFAQELRNHLETFSPDEIDEMVTLIAEQSVDVGNLVEDLLVAARADAGNLTVIPSDIDLREQVQSVMCGLAESSRHQISIGGESVVAYADEKRVRQVIRNLVTNAIRYGGDHIEIVTANGSCAALTVRDNGPGIPDSKQQLIFEPYYRAHEKTGQTDSVGLGLTVSRQLARLMGGDLTYRNEGTWSTMELVLPLGRTPPTSVDEAAGSSAPTRRWRWREVGIGDGR